MTETISNTRLYDEHAIAELARARLRCFFGDELAPCIIAMTPVSPHGRWIGLTCYSRAGGAHLIYLTTSGKLNGGRGVLLHEMVHAWIVQQGRDASHAGAPWCEERICCVERRRGSG